MPINNWNFFRSVSACNDQKAWLEDNPQVEDNREGGNQDFDDGISDQYEDEVSHMMRRLKLNFYRAEDEMFIMRKRVWRKEDEEFAKEQKRRAKEKHERRIKKNRERRQRKEEEEMAEIMKDERAQEDQLGASIRSVLVCSVCHTPLAPPTNIYSCRQGHSLCEGCRNDPALKTCPLEECGSGLAGRDPAMERVAKVVFSWSTAKEMPSAPLEEEEGV